MACVASREERTIASSEFESRSFVSSNDRVKASWSDRTCASVSLLE
jgi:hypothetical protein